MMIGLPDDMIGAIKIKDGLFIGDEFAAQVKSLLSYLIGLGVRHGQQSQPHYQLRWQTGPKPLGSYRGRLLKIQLARPRKLGAV